MINEKIYKVSEMDNDTLHLINDKVKEFMSQLKQNLNKDISLADLQYK